MAQEGKSPAVDVAKERRDRDEAVILSTGVRARFVPVASSLITDVLSAIKDPPIPVVFIKEKERDEENPNDPEYLKLMREVKEKRDKVSMDTMILFGIELLDEIPEDGAWINKLRYMEKLGHLNLESYDLTDPIEREFLYKRYIAVSSDDLIEILKRSGISEDDIAQAMKTFPSPTEQSTD